MTSDDYNVHDAIMAQLDESKLSKSKQRDLLWKIICELNPNFTEKEALDFCSYILAHTPSNGATMRKLFEKLSERVMGN